MKGAMRSSRSSRRLPLASALLALSLTGCGSTPASPAPAQPETDSGFSGDAVTAEAEVASEAAPEDTAPPVVCDPPSIESACKNGASIIRGVVRLAPGLVPSVGTVGRIVIGLTHHRGLGEYAQGGHLHWYKVLPKKDLAAGPIPFQLDMCGGGTAMWSEDNCEFNLVVLLDANGNNGVTGEGWQQVPDPGEPATRKVIDLSCRGESPCLDVVLDCVDGASCVSYTDPGACKCAAKTCDSPSTICKP